MVIIDKRKHIKTLNDLGATLAGIRMTFFYQGALIILIGGAIGIVLGAVIIWLQQSFELVMITSELPYPVLFELSNVILVYTTIVVLGFLAARLAATRINEKLIASS
jgi:lipoprotein-releasing system permease protein